MFFSFPTINAGENNQNSEVKEALLADNRLLTSQQGLNSYFAILSTRRQEYFLSSE
jgi:hypothetical protein